MSRIPMTQRRLTALRDYAEGQQFGYEVADLDTNRALERAGMIRYVGDSQYEITPEGRARISRTQLRRQPHNPKESK